MEQERAVRSGFPLRPWAWPCPRQVAPFGPLIRNPLSCPWVVFPHLSLGRVLVTNLSLTWAVHISYLDRAGWRVVRPASTGVIMKVARFG